ncbi:MAG: hypothetical protein AAF723_07410, partial [Pseudomonadota bacterium]
MAGRSIRKLALMTASTCISLVSISYAQNLSLEDEAAILRGRLLILEEQAAQAEIRAQERVLELEVENANLEKRMSVLESQVKTLLALQTTAKTETASVSQGGPTPPSPRPQVTQRAPVQTAETAPQTVRPRPEGQAARPAAPVRTASAEPDTVGERPESETRSPNIELFNNTGGILTGGRDLKLETGFNYSTSSDNRFFFSGLEIVDALLVGVIEATDTDRQSITFSQGARLGLSDRFEIDVTVPYVIQDDRIAGIVLGDDQETLRDLSGDGIGDITAGAHYQLNRGGG